MFNLFWYAVVCLVSLVIRGSVKFVEMTSFSRRDLLKVLENNGRSPSDGDYRARVEQMILVHFDLLAEELVDKKAFRTYCSLFASKVRDWYTSKECDYHLDRVIDNHKVTKDILFENHTKCHI